MAAEKFRVENASYHSQRIIISLTAGGDTPCRCLIWAILVEPDILGAAEKQIVKMTEAAKMSGDNKVRSRSKPDTLVTVKESL